MNDLVIYVQVNVLLTLNDTGLALAHLCVSYYRFQGVHRETGPQLEQAAGKLAINTLLMTRKG